MTQSPCQLSNETSRSCAMILWTKQYRFSYVIKKLMKIKDERKNYARVSRSAINSPFVILLLTLSAIKTAGNDTFLLRLPFSSFFHNCRKKVGEMMNRRHGSQHQLLCKLPRNNFTPDFLVGESFRRFRAKNHVKAWRPRPGNVAQLPRTAARLYPLGY